MKSSRTVALGLVALAVFSDLGVAQQKGEENTPTAGASSSNSISPTGPLSNAQLNTIVGNIEERHKQINIDQGVANLLGISKNGEPLTLRYRALQERHDIIHGFYLLEGKAASVGFLLLRRTAEGATVFHADASLNAISVVITPSDRSGVRVVPLNESTKRTLHDELLWWADIANQLIANAKWDKGDLDGAIADYNRALELDPRDATAYYNRGSAKAAKGDLDGAIADYNRAIELDPRDAYYYRARGNTRDYKGEFVLATADMARSQELEPDAYTALRLYLLRGRSGIDGKNEFVTNTTKLDTSKWPAPVLALYLGRGTPAAVLSGAENPGPKTRREQVCEANFFVGQWQLLQGDRANALTSLRATRDQCPKSFAEYNGAVYELKRLGAQ